jgi:hypothetical protein
MTTIIFRIRNSPKVNILLIILLVVIPLYSCWTYLSLDQCVMINHYNFSLLFLLLLLFALLLLLFLLFMIQVLKLPNGSNLLYISRVAATP